MTPRPRIDPDEAMRGSRTAWGWAAGATAADLIVLAWAASTWMAIGRLERDEVQIVEAWAPVAWLYELGGRYVAMAPFLLLSILATVVMAGAVLRARELAPFVTEEARRRAARADRAEGPAFLTATTDDSGHVPTRTIVLGAILLLMVVGTAVYISTGRAERERVRQSEPR